VKKVLSISILFLLVQVLLFQNVGYAQESLQGAQHGINRSAEFRILACPSILNNLHSDWQGTRWLFRTYGPQAEINPITRTVGPDVYFSVLIVGTSLFCKEDQGWQAASWFIWALQTWAVGNLIQLGFQGSPPLIYFTFRW
jgi:hypothetical protein